MKISYTKEPARPSPAHPDRQNILRPNIVVRLRHGDRAISVYALIDSGADDCLFPAVIAHTLGLPLDDKRSEQYGGIGAGVIRASFASVTLEVGEWSLRVAKA